MLSVLCSRGIIPLLTVSLFVLSALLQPAWALELPQHRTYKLSCLFVPDAGSIEIELRPHSSDSTCIEAHAAVNFAGIAGRLSGMRQQRYSTVLDIERYAVVTSIYHHQEVEVNHSGRRIRYAWAWQRNDTDNTFVAQRFWGGALKQTTKLDGGGDVVSDLLSLLFRVGAHIDTHGYGSQRHHRLNPHGDCAEKLYTLLDPAGNIRVNASFDTVEDASSVKVHVLLDFSRSPLTLGASRLELWFSPAGEILRGRIGAVGGLLALDFTLTR